MRFEIHIDDNKIKELDCTLQQARKEFEFVVNYTSEYHCVQLIEVDESLEDGFEIICIRKGSNYWRSISDLEDENESLYNAINILKEKIRDNENRIDTLRREGMDY